MNLNESTMRLTATYRSSETKIKVVRDKQSTLETAEAKDQNMEQMLYRKDEVEVSETRADLEIDSDDQQSDSDGEQAEIKSKKR